MQRPTSVKVLSILNIAFGVLGLCGLVNQAGLVFGEGDPDNPVVGIIRDSPLYHGYLVASIPVGLIGSAALIGAGVGMINGRAWGRTLSILYAWYAIVTTLVGVVITLQVLMPPAMAVLDEDMTRAETALVAAAFGGSCVSAIGMIYPIVLLCFMYRASVRRWFDPNRPPSALPAGPDPFGPPLEPWER